MNSTKFISCNRSISMSKTDELIYVDQLKPYANYTFKLMAYTSCYGDTASLTSSTSASAPHKPTSVNSAVINATAIKVTWRSPDLCTGITSFSVNYTDMVNNSTKNKLCSDSAIQGFYLNECIINGLEEFWNYTFEVVATVMTFPSNISDPVNAKTLESTPGPVQNLELIPEADPTQPRSINVTWMAPKEIDENGVVHFYRIICKDNASNAREKYVKFRRGEAQSIRFENLTAEIIYFINVSANTSVGFGTPVENKTKIESGALLPHKMMLKRSTVEATEPRRQLAINLPISDFFCNFMYGSPHKAGIIVAQSSRTDDNIYIGNSSYYISTVITNYRSWSDVHDSDNVPPYRATSDEWKPPVECASYSRKKRSTGSQNTPEFVSYIVGEDKDCEGTSGTYCNGYLKPYTEYKVKIFMCTKNGCTESEWSEAMKTDYDPTVAITVPVVLVLLTSSAIVVVFLLRRKRMVCFKDSKLLQEATNRHNREQEMRPRANVHRPIKLTQLREHVANMHKNTNLLFSSEYKELKEVEPKHPTEAAQIQACRSKNRYTNILSFDHSRVKLLPIEDEPGSDYINANYIQGLNGKREYIATQGPLPSTNNDFWRMVWEQKAAIIVMLTKCMENGKVKCDQYWPEVKEPVYYGELVVNVTSESFIHDYVIRVIEITLDKDKKKVFHFSYLNWPDMGCPKDPTSLINFVTTVRKYVKPNLRTPIIVHCSAGVGRTGTYIAIDYLMQFVQNHDEIDIFHLVYQLRDQRCNMVQTEDQYIFIHDSMVHFLAEDDEDEGDHDISPDGENIYENTGFIKD